MNQLLRARGFLVFGSSVLCALAVAVGCSDITPSPAGSTTLLPSPDGSAATPGVDASDPVPTAEDAGVDAQEVTDASDAAVALKGCAARPTASFCDDFDSPDALTAGKTKWDFIEPTDQPVATLSTVQKVSAPSSLLSRIIDGTTPGAKFAKTITKAGFTEAKWEYDVFFDKIGTTDGFFVDDLQFSDSGGPDSYGFRLVMFSNAGAIGDLRVEHNAGANGGPYVIEPGVTAGTVALGQWHHFTQTVKFTFASADAGAGDAGDAGAADAVEYSLTVDDSATPAFKKKYAGITRQQAAFTRIAGMPLVFNKANSAGLAIYWDNHVVDLK